MVWWLPDFVVDGVVSVFNWATSSGGEAQEVGPIQLTPSTPSSGIESEAGEDPPPRQVAAEAPADVEATTPAQGDDSRPPEVDGERPQLLLPETLDVAEHEPPPAVEPAKPELPTALTDSLPKTEIRAVQSAPIAGIGHISETQPQAAEPEIQGVSPPTGQGVEKLIKPAGIAAATFLAVATLGGLLWAFDKWKGRGTKKEGKKKAKKGGKKERRHVRQWTVYDE